MFVADFIGEMNQIPAVADAKNRVRFGSAEMECAPHQFNDGQKIIAAIRPNDIIPHGDNAHSLGQDDVVETESNALDVEVGEMEFLGSFWRCRLNHELFGDSALIADFSINAVRRLGLSEHSKMLIELPVNRLMAFAVPE